MNEVGASGIEDSVSKINAWAEELLVISKVELHTIASFFLSCQVLSSAILLL